jgi:hypothetical protein
MKLHSISNLVVDDNQQSIDKSGPLYDLTTQTFRWVTGLNISSHTITRDEEMRMDLVSYNLFSTTDYLDILMDFNDIDNPLNIMQDDVIFYVSPETFDMYKVYPQTMATNKILLNQNKANIKDNARVNYIENNYQLAPTFLDTPKSPISYSNGKITISPI